MNKRMAQEEHQSFDEKRGKEGWEGVPAPEMGEGVVPPNHAAAASVRRQLS